MPCQMFAATLDSTIERLGLSLTTTQSIKSYLVAPLLFLGPLYGHFLFQTLPFQKYWDVNVDLIPIFTSLQGARNFIIVCSIPQP
jgi:prenyl protein peptidase